MRGDDDDNMMNALLLSEIIQQDAGTSSWFPWSTCSSSSSSSSSSSVLFVPSSLLLLAALAVVVVVVVIAACSYRFSTQYRIESALRKQGIPGQYAWSIPFLGHVGQYWDPGRLLIENLYAAADAAAAAADDDDDDDNDNVNSNKKAATATLPPPPLQYLTVFGHTLLVFNDAAWSTELWAVSHKWPKSDFFYQSINVLFGTTKKTLVTHKSTTNPAWHRKRTIVSHSLHKQNMAQLAMYIEEQVKALCKRWIQQGTEIDVDTDLTNLTLRVIVYFIFGRSLSISEVHPLQEALTYMLEFSWRMAANPFLAIQAKIPGSGPYQASQAFRGFVRKLIQHTRQQQQQQQQQQEEPSSGHHHPLISDFLAESSWSEEVLENEIMTLLFAGHDTTAHGTAIALEQCLCHPTVVDAIRQEYDDFVKTMKQQQQQTNNKNNESSCVDVSAFYFKMKWPTAALKESLRLHPEAPGGTVRVAPTDVQLHVEKSSSPWIVVPQGCAVLSPMCIYSRSRGNWGPDALEFKPERFLSIARNENNKENSTSSRASRLLLPRNYIPFSLGKRNCVGMPLAYMEGSMLLGYILTHLDCTIRSHGKQVWTMTLRVEDFLIDVKERQREKGGGHVK